MRRSLLLLALVPLCLANGGGCGGTHLAFVKPAPDKLVCAPDPDRPVGSGPQYVDPNGVTRNQITDDDNGTYLRELRDTGQDCRSKVDWLRDFFANLKE